MGDSQQELITIILAAAAFVLVLSIWTVVTLVILAHHRRGQQTITARLELDDDRPTRERTLKLWHQGEEVTSNIQVPIQSRGLMLAINGELHRAGWTISGVGSRFPSHDFASSIARR